jgi:PhnB protein
VAAGSTLMMPPTDQFYGERSARVRDPFGHFWLLGHSIEELSPEEMQRRYTALLASS